tara:strand:+ start:119 stop:484 length:366 start_codon:yes stop_codon:yes gene_type:complete
MPGLLNGEKNRPEFLDRIDNPEKYPHIKNPDGSVSSHRMAAEVDESGQWYAFPTIVQLPSGELHRFENAFEALEYNKKTGNLLKMDTAEEAMDYASGGYKTKKFLNHGRAVSGGLLANEPD